jgi:predicted lipoprotein
MNKILSIGLFTMFKQTSTLLLTSALLLISGCGANSTSETKDTNTELEIAARNIIDNVIIPSAINFKSKTEKLNTETHSFCTEEMNLSTPNLTIENLDTLKLTWITVTNAWYTLLPYKFGPMEADIIVPNFLYIDSYRNDNTDRTDRTRNTINTIIAGSDTITDNYLSNATPSSVGLLPLEVILFESPIADFSTPNHRLCSILKAYSTELAAKANLIASGWTSNYRNSGKSYRTLLLNNQLDTILDNEDGSSAMSKIVVSVQDYFDYINRRNITTDQAKISNTIWRHLLASINSVNSILHEDNSGSISVIKLMVNNGYQQEAENVNNNIALLLSTIDVSYTNITSATDMKAAAALLDGNFKREIADGLGVNAGLNFSDGD